MALDYKKRALQRGEARKQSNTYKLKEGTNTFRIAPTPEGSSSQELFFEFNVHEKVGPKGSFVRCGKDAVSGKGNCYICDVIIKKLRKQGKNSRAALLAPKNKLVLQVWNVRKGKIVEPALLWYPSTKVGQSLLTSLLQSKKRDYVSLKKGYNVSIDRTGTGMLDTKYGAIEPDEEPSKVPSAFAESLKPFDELDSIPAYSEKKQKMALSGGTAVIDDDDDDEDEDEKPKSKKSRKGDYEDDDDDDDDNKKKKKKRRDDDDDDDEDDDKEEDDDDDDDDEDEEEDDEDDKPAKKKKKLKKKPRDDDDDDDDDDEDEDDD